MKGIVRSVVVLSYIQQQYLLGCNRCSATVSFICVYIEQGMMAGAWVETQWGAQT